MDKCIGSQRNLGMDAEVILRCTSVAENSEWLFTEADKLDDGDWLLYGYNHIIKWEWGYVKFSQLPETFNEYEESPHKTVKEYMEEKNVK